MPFALSISPSIAFRHLAFVVFICLSCLAAACSRQNTPAAATDEHEHLSRTEFTARVENFFEYDPLRPDRESEFLIHLTDLSDGSPVANAEVAVVLRPTGTQTEAVQARATVGKTVGVYVAKLKPTGIGEFDIEFRVKNDKIDDRMLLTGFKVERESPSVTQDHDDSADSVAFLMEQQWLIRMKSARVESGSVNRRISALGRIVAAPQNHAVVAPPVGGVLSGTALPRVGQAIKQGQTLCVVRQAPTAFEHAENASNNLQLRVENARLDAERRRLEQEKHEAQARLSLAEADHRRARQLFSAGLISESELQKAAAELKAAEAVRASAETQRGALDETPRSRLSEVDLEQDHPLVAPISGIVTAVRKAVGEQVSAGETVVEIVNLDTVWVEAPIFEQDLNRVTPKTRAVFSTLADPATEFVGRLVGSGAVVDEHSRTTTVLFELANPGQVLKIGMRADVRLESDEPVPTILVPREAVLDNEGKKIVYVMLSGEAFQRRQVVTGDRYGDRVAVTSGLAGGERVVTQGAYQLKLQELKPADPGAHTHEH